VQCHAGFAIESLIRGRRANAVGVADRGDPRGRAAGGAAGLSALPVVGRQELAAARLADERDGHRSPEKIANALTVR